MRYFTKEWYNDTVLSEVCFQMRSTSHADKFSEKHFKSLYEGQKKWFMRSEKIIARQNKVKYDAEAAAAAFDASYNENLEFVKKNIPAEILEKVADVRVLAMGSASYDVFHEITRYCGQVNRKCEAVKAEYDREVEALAEKIGWYKINCLNWLLNAPISAAKSCDDGNFVLTTTPDYTDVACKVTLSGAQEILCPNELVGAAILHLELLPAGELLEFNLLCMTTEGKSVTFSAKAADIETENVTNQ
jgi:hypothetical protein